MLYIRIIKDGDPVDIRATVAKIMGHDWPTIELYCLTQKHIADTHVAVVRVSDVLRPDKPYRWTLISDGVAALLFPVQSNELLINGITSAENARQLIGLISEFVVNVSRLQADVTLSAGDRLTVGELSKPVIKSARALVNAVAKRGSDKWMYRAVSGDGSSESELFPAGVEKPPRKERVSQGRKKLIGTIDCVDSGSERLTLQIDGGETVVVHVCGANTKGTLRAQFRVHEISIVAEEYISGSDR